MRGRAAPKSGVIKDSRSPGVVPLARVPFSSRASAPLNRKLGEVPPTSRRSRHCQDGRSIQFDELYFGTAGVAWPPILCLHAAWVVATACGAKGWLLLEDRNSTTIGSSACPWLG